ncbi:MULTISPECIES: DUF3995 domain-containing protein [Flavobacteriaceae]|uniref:DUF3995 domain-containing protein n=1 Tax=Flavobacteriaceae TaxID=49546 RepID=UPI001490902B|nr:MULTISPECIES: DUF3995 domain-containing protein [Allomuricauda]MDC6367426.1 DUF3995 domain-containing protein [Muricauda sp. AC10]
MDVLAVIIFIVMIFLAALHFYWSIYGIKEPSSPSSISVNKTVRPPNKFVAVVVGVILFLFAFVFINKVMGYTNHPWLKYLSIGIGVIFILRAFGGFKNVGSFRTAKNSKFTALNPRYYPPLCLLFGVLIIILEYFG